MGDTRQKIQLELAFTAERKGEARTPDRKGTESSLARYESESLAESERLMEAVCEPRNLKQALRRVKGNDGSPGIEVTEDNIGVVAGSVSPPRSSRVACSSVGT